jgi:capsid assembly protease
MRAAVDLAMARTWAIRPESLQTILAIAQRQTDGPEALAAKLGRPLQNAQNATMRGSVAVVPVVGPVFRYANVFTDVSGATSTELLARDFSAAVENPKVRAIVLSIDSPGGEAAGINELAKLIAAGAKQKPVVAYASGMMASGAYWLASAAGEIVADDTAMLGSVGVVLSAQRRNGDANFIEVVSSQSPAKRADPASPEGRAQIQRLADELAAVFVRAVASNRAVSEAHVLERFGRGGLMLAAAAITAGMADRIGTMEGVIAELEAGRNPERAPVAQGMAGQAFHPAASAADNPVHQHSAADDDAAAVAFINETLKRRDLAGSAPTAKSPAELVREIAAMEAEAPIDSAGQTDGDEGAALRLIEEMYRGKGRAA